MGSPAKAAAAEVSAATETAFPAVALLDGQGTVVGWSQTAQRLVGYSAAEVVGRSADVLFVAADDRAKASQIAQESVLRGGWSDLVQVRHRNGHSVEVRLCVSSLSGQDGRGWWVVCATDKALIPTWPAKATGGEPLLARLPNCPPIGVVVRDTHLRCIQVNDTQGSRDGIPVRRRLGRRLTEAVPGREAETLEAVMHQVLVSGDPAINVDYRAFLPANERHARTLTASFFRLDDARGRALGVCVVSVDASDSRRARERLTILGTVSRRIGTTLDVMQTAQELADLAVPLLADYVTVDLAESVPLGEEPLAHLGPQDGRIPVFRRAGLASIHPGTPESLFARGEPVFVPPTSPFTGVLHSGRSHFEPVLDTSPDTWLEHHDPARAKKIRENAMHSLMVVPIHARGVVLGVEVFARTEDPRPFEEDDLLLAEELVSWAALALDNARQYARERSAALALQRLLHPRRPTGGSAADVAWRYLPADSHHGIGGDWFDVIPLSGARVALVVGDVVGHGINAAAKMGQLRTALHTLADTDMPPDEVLSRLDEQVIRFAEAEDPCHPDTTMMAATCLYAVYDPVTRTCTMARAGHPPPAVIAPCGHVTFPDLPAGAPLGLGLVPFESTTVELAEGSVLALYTDGLIEARHQDITDGMNRLRAALSRPALTLDDLCSSTVDTLRVEPPGDDVTLLLARTCSLSTDKVASWQFPSAPAVASHARTVAARQLTRWGLEHLAESTELIISELFTNALVHGNGDCGSECRSDRTIGLRLIRHEMLTLEVSDASHSHPLVRHARSTDEHGRGLFLVAQLSRRWGTRHIPDGKIIWADQQLPSGA
ncbi:SpoIIE family protein phosphatase [Streptomyces sp. NPDC048489]|uniref:SpoIIE family protein phosphatase n=1 Tax=Streptomyces sp. NPDC048489 TaxID=3154504 RepID=UPI00342A6262